MVRRGAAAKPLRMGYCGCGPGVPSRERVARGWNAPAKVLASILACRVDGSTLGHRFSRWGRHLGAKILLHGALW
jgi:hypothetical protein